MSRGWWWCGAVCWVAAQAGEVRSWSVMAVAGSALAWWRSWSVPAGSVLRLVVTGSAATVACSAVDDASQSGHPQPDQHHDEGDQQESGDLLGDHCGGGREGIDDQDADDGIDDHGQADPGGELAVDGAQLGRVLPGALVGDPALGSPLVAMGVAAVADSGRPAKAGAEVDHAGDGQLDGRAGQDQPGSPPPGSPAGHASCWWRQAAPGGWSLVLRAARAGGWWTLRAAAAGAVSVTVVGGGRPRPWRRRTCPAGGSGCGPPGRPSRPRTSQSGPCRCW